MAAAIALASARAVAGPPPPTQTSAELIEQALQLRERGLDPEAVSLLRRAVEMDPSARARAQLALGQQATADWIGAEQNLTEALSDADDAWITRHRATLEGALETVRRHLGWIDLETTPSDAQCWIDGAPVERAGGAPLRATAGPHRVRVEAAGRASVEHEVTVPSREHVRVAWALPPNQPLLQADAPAPQVAPAPRPEVRAPESSQRTWASAALGGAGAFLIAGVIGHAIRAEHVATYNDDSQCPPGQRLARCGGERDIADRATVVMAIGYGGAAALAATGALLLVTAPRDTLSVTAWAMPETFGLGLRGAF